MKWSRWLAAVLFFGPVLGLACAWDDDTLGIELRSQPTVRDALTGRVERLPAEYYLRRIAIQTEKLRRDPKNLAAYDNIAVAYDRLGDSESAIKWIQNKRPFVGDNKEHQYRTEANEGTFWAHLWTHRGSNPKDLGPLKKGRAMIARAIQINPDAHFGRESAQLLVMDWMLEGKPDKSLLDFIRAKRPADTVKLREGLAGLMLLGVAWENPDIASSLAIVRNDGFIGELALIRTDELTKAGKKSLRKLPDHTPARPIFDRYKEDVRSDFKRLRANGDEFRANLVAYVEGKMAAGSHPDSDPDFWRDYKATPPLALATSRPWIQQPNSQTVLIVAAILGLGLFVITYGVWRIWKWRCSKKRLRKA